MTSQNKTENNETIKAETVITVSPCRYVISGIFYLLITSDRNSYHQSASVDTGDCFKKSTLVGWARWQMPLVPVLGRQRQTDVSELEAILVHMSSSNQADTPSPCVCTYFITQLLYECLPACLSVHHWCALPVVTTRGHWILELEIKGLEQLPGCWEMNPTALGKCPVSLAPRVISPAPITRQFKKVLSNFNVKKSLEVQIHQPEDFLTVYTFVKIHKLLDFNFYK